MNTDALAGLLGTTIATVGTVAIASEGIKLVRDTMGQPRQAPRRAPPRRAAPPRKRRSILEDPFGDSF